MSGWAITTLVAVIGVFGGLIGQLYSRIHKLETDIIKSRRYNRKMWVWARRHIDLYYRYRREGSPEPEPLPDDEDDEG